MRSAGVVLAAGFGRRFGAATKQLAQVRGQPLVEHVTRSALAAGLDEVVVVVGHDGVAVASALPEDPRVRHVHNPAYHDGLGTSVAVGLTELGVDVDVAVMLLADQPGVAPTAIRAVRQAVVDGAEIARARYDDGHSHPVALARAVWPLACRPSGDRGARQLFSQPGVVSVPVPGRRPGDVDRPGDLEDPAVPRPNG